MANFTRIAVFVVSIAATATLAWLLGTAYGNRRIQHTRSQRAEEWAHIQAEEMKGIAVGRAFPTVPLWSVDGTYAFNDPRELLPEGGMLVMLSADCSACIDIASAFQEARNLMPESPPTIVLVFEGSISSALLSSLRAHDVSLPVTVDAEEILIRIHNVKNLPSYFALDESGVLRFSGYGRRNSKELMSLLGEYCSPVEHQSPKGGKS